MSQQLTVVPPVITPIVAPTPVAFPDGAAVSLPVTTIDAPVKVPPVTTAGSEMTLARYNDNSIVVRGPADQTKKYAGNFKELHGKWNPHLSGGPGWIFGNVRESELQSLLAGIKAGAIAPVPQAPKEQRGGSKQRGRQQEHQQPMYGHPMPGYPPMPPMYGHPMTGYPPMPGYPPMQFPTMPAAPSHVHGTHQTITYSGIFKPQVGMTAQVRGQNIDFHGKVIRADVNQDGTVTSVSISVPEAQGSPTYEVGLWNGHWALRAHPYDHTVFFKNQ